MIAMTMSDPALQAAVAVTIPTFAVFVGILMNNARLNDLRTHMDSRFNEVDRRFDDLTEIWRSELHRVEEVLDARLKHPEQR